MVQRCLRDSGRRDCQNPAFLYTGGHRMKQQAFDFSVNLMRSILWQYEGAPKAIALAQADQDFIDQNHSEFWDNWITDVFDLTTANAFGLAVWARILDLPISITEVRNVEDVWGFGVYNENFENGGFGVAADTDLMLDVESARQLLRLRWVQLTMRPTVPNINRALEDILGPGIVEVIDEYDMLYATYFFQRTPDYKLRRLLERTNVLPRPSTVGVQWVVQVRLAFGFGEHHLNFNNGSFGA